MKKLFLKSKESGIYEEVSFKTTDYKYKEFPRMQWMIENGM